MLIGGQSAVTMTFRYISLINICTESESVNYTSILVIFQEKGIFLRAADEGIITVNSCAVQSSESTYVSSAVNCNICNFT